MNLNDVILSMQGSWHRELAALLLLWAASYGIGLPLLERFGMRRNGGRGAGIAAAVIGFDLLAILFRLGDFAVIALSPAWLWCILIPPALYGAWRCAGALRERENAILFAAVLMLGAFTLSAALLIPYTWDEQSYQAALAYRYLEAGSTRVLLDNPYSALSSMPHFPMLWGVKLTGVCFPKLLTWSSYLLIIPLFYLLLRRFGRGTAAILTGVFLISPLTGGMWREVYLESFILLNLLAGFCAVGIFRRKLEALALFLGFAAGCCAAVKLTGGAASLALAGVFFGVIAREDRKRIYRLLLIAGAGAVLAMIPFYLRAFLATGNPLYPFGASLLDPASGAAAVEAYHSLLGRSRYGLSGVASLFGAWVLVAFKGEIFDGMVLGWQFPLLLILGSVALFRQARRLSFLKWAFLGGVAFYLFWGLSSQQSRFLLPFFCPAAFYAGAGLCFFRRRYRRGALVLLVLAALVSFESPVYLSYWNAWQIVRTTKREQPARFLGHAGRDVEYANALDYVSRNTPPGAKVMMLFDRRGLYMPRRYVLATPFFQEEFFTPVPATAAEVQAEISRWGADYLFVAVGVNPRNPDPLPEYDEANEQLTLRLLELVKRGRLLQEKMPDAGPYLLLKVVH